VELPDLTGVEGFDWSKGNDSKIWNKHRVHAAECEEVFFHTPLVVHPDELHSDYEPRFYALGRTARFRLLFLVFTVRKKQIRVISARDMTRREKAAYESIAQEDSEI
jgi:hypothetical protein